MRTSSVIAPSLPKQGVGMDAKSNVWQSRSRERRTVGSVSLRTSTWAWLEEQATQEQRPLSALLDRMLDTYRQNAEPKGPGDE